MFLRILVRSLSRRRSRKFLAVFTICVGISLVVALLTLSLDVNDKMGRELSSFGANIRVEPSAASVPVRVGGHELASHAGKAYLDEREMEELTAIFWRNNILGVVPCLWTKARAGAREVPLLGVWFERRLPVEDGEPIRSGAREVYKHWRIEGVWPSGAEECLAGADLAGSLGLKLGERVELAGETLSLSLRISGIATTGGREDHAIIAPLGAAQRLAGLSGKISLADVSALTTPENKLAAKHRLDPTSLSPDEYERWYCTPYPGSVAADIQKAIPGSTARVVRRVSETQGAVLGRIEGLMAILGILTLAVCCLSVICVLTSAVLERRPEVALLQAIGAHRGRVLILFFCEAAVLGLCGGSLAAAFGPLLGQWLVGTIFGSGAETHVVLVIISPFLGLVIAWAASLWPVWLVLNQNTSQVLHGN